MFKSLTIPFLPLARPNAKNSVYSRKVLARLYQTTDYIISGSRILERIQSKLGKNRNKMFHDFRLDRFITRPVLIGRETINLYGQTILRRSQRAHHQQQVLTDKRMALQIESHISTKQPYIRIDGSIYQSAGLSVFATFPSAACFCFSVIKSAKSASNFFIFSKNSGVQGCM